MRISDWSSDVCSSDLDPALVLVEQVLELRPLPLVAGGVHVRDVVGDDLDVQLLCGHSRRGDAQGLHAGLPSAAPRARIPVRYRGAVAPSARAGLRRSPALRPRAGVALALLRRFAWGVPSG